MGVIVVPDTSPFQWRPCPAENLAFRTQHETKSEDNMKPATIARADFGKKKVVRTGRIADAVRTMVMQGITIHRTI